MSEKKHMFSNRELVRLILPLMVEQTLVTLVGMADSVIVSSVGEAAVSAVSLIDSVNILLFNIFTALATGGAIIAGQFLGQKSEEEARHTGEQVLQFIVAVALGIVIVMYLSKGFLLTHLFGTIEADVMRYADTYLSIVLLGLPFLAFYTAGAALFRVVGDSGTSMKISLMMNLVNVSGNLFLIYGMHRGVEGVAIPTALSYAFAASLVFWKLHSPKMPIGLRRGWKPGFNKRLIRRICYVGVPNGIENSMFQLGKLILVSVVATFGTSSIAANAVSNAISNFGIIGGMSINLAVVTVVSRCVGAGDFEQARYYTRKLFRCVIAAQTVINGVIALLLPVFIQLYHLSAETGELVTKIVLMHCFFACWLWAFSFTLPNTLRASSDAKYTMLVGVSSMWLCRLCLGYVFAVILDFGVIGIWMAMMCDWAVRSIFFVVRYLGGKWERMAIG
ncbi:MAG: MATE family efflux transporter [Clostridiales bacterium]|nr:MATE family efflux transporter [Clostridiales bacterium]